MWSSIFCLILGITVLIGCWYLFKYYTLKNKIKQIREFKGVVLSKNKLEGIEHIRHYPAYYHQLPIEYSINLPPRYLVKIQLDNLELITINNEEVFKKIKIGDKIEIIVEELSNKKGVVLKYKPLQLLAPFHEVLCQDDE